MKVSVSNIPEEGLSLKFVKNREWLENAVSSDQAESFTCIQDIQVSCTLRRLKENVFLEGSIGTVLELSCCRCLEAAMLPVDTAFRYTLVPLPDRQDSEIELDSEDLEYSYYHDDAIDLEPLIFEQIILQIPIKALCRDDCRGLCPHCGANLNTATCHCGDAVVDDRFAVLKTMKIQKNK